MTAEVRQDAIRRYLEQAFQEPVELEGIGSIGDLSEQGMNAVHRPAEFSSSTKSSKQCSKKIALIIATSTAT